jgi:hypothetical protein
MGDESNFYLYYGSEFWPEVESKKEEWMKPFDLVRALAGEPVVTRNGKKVDELHYFETARGEHPLIVGFDGQLWGYTVKGTRTYPSESPYDLFMAPKKRTVWVNIWNIQGRRELTGYVHDSQERANATDDPWVLNNRIGGKAWPLEIEE